MIWISHSLYEAMYLFLKACRSRKEETLFKRIPVFRSLIICPFFDGYEKKRKALLHIGEIHYDRSTYKSNIAGFSHGHYTIEHEPFEDGHIGSLKELEEIGYYSRRNVIKLRT